MKKNSIQIGDKFYKLEVISLSHIDDKHRRFYLFKCDCGNKKIIHGSAVVSGNTKSCGCYKAESYKKRRIPNNHGEVTAIIAGYLRHANSRGKEWCLSRSFVENIIKENCFYCGSPPSNLKKTKNSIDGLKYNGIDRIDNNIGYVEENCVACCQQCNLSKRDLNIEEFKTWIKKLITKWESLL